MSVAAVLQKDIALWADFSGRMEAVQRTRNTGAHLHALHGLQAARKLVPQRYVFLQHGRHGHRHTLRGCACSGRFSVRVLQAQGRATHSHGRCQRRLR